MKNSTIDIAKSPHATYLAHLEQGDLAYQVTPGGEAVFFPRIAAPGTGAALEWRVSAGTGQVHSCTTMRRRGELAENLSLIELDEGFRMMSRVVGLPPEEVRIGLRVTLKVLRDGDAPLPVFVPAEDRA